ncbi:right-handed parallel beta-helix repeat-containing protein [Flavobacterium granuli]|uniref:Alpha-N-arabinofuranosidase n=1 Tax=Flavobacterium granuli TaxID=280093 RepID=A0ABU1S0U3_9FLAO|nr:right-handed parallel beta-helix repeat-containing protein [Flavobacterium granuli]MDR6844657.1 alpha-N-arabinofuranosidase [Flavobacterium granuli]
MKKKLIFVVLVFCTAIIAKAQTEYYVSATKGSDANKGSKEKPFKTISAAAKVAKAGDVITVHAGTYRESIQPEVGGISDTKRITYQAAKGENVVIKGSEVVKKWTKIGNDTWKAIVPNTMFGSFNPFNDLIRGDWFLANGRQHHTGCVYLNGKWLMEAAKKEDVTNVAIPNDPLWFAEVDAQNTTIYAQFIGVDPNKELVEVNARETVFYPKKAFVNYITVKGFTMCHAATNWAPPTAEQKGLIGTHWSKGWIIENNDISYSKCSGVSLGKYGDEWDNKAESAEGYVGTINRALANMWNKENIGGHIVRNNTIAFCEQTGIVGSMGCAFSMISGNTIHDIHFKKLFSGYEMAGIKFHGAVDVQIIGNHIYRSDMGVWLDWMAQGIHVANNLMHDNIAWDLFLEVNHGPMLVYNNVLLSKVSVFMNSRGAVFAHNLFGGKVNAISYDSRLTPYHKPHSTDIVALHDNPAGDIQFRNNLFISGGEVSQYKKNILPVFFDGNVYTKGSVMAVLGDKQRSFGEINEQAKEKVKNVPDVDAVEKNFISNENFDADAKLITEGKSVYLEIKLDKNWLTDQKRTLVSTDNLGRTIVSKLPYENTDGTKFVIDKDYNGAKRLETNPSPGPFEIKTSGEQKMKVF